MKMKTYSVTNLNTNEQRSGIDTPLEILLVVDHKITNINTLTNLTNGPKILNITETPLLNL